MASGRTIYGATLYGLAGSSFTGSDENPLSESGVWSTGSGETAWKRLTNTAQPTDPAGGDNTVRYSGLTFPAAQYSRGKLTVNSTAGGARGVGLTVRNAAGAATYYRVVMDHAATNNAELGKKVAGAYTALVTWTKTFAHGDQFTLLADGSFIQVYDKNMMLVASVWDNAVTSGSPGLTLSTAVTSASVDDWEGGKLVVEVPPRIRRRFRRRQARDGMMNDITLQHWF